jgi:RNA polymerase sporulation-specific sigma factor
MDKVRPVDDTVLIAKAQAGDHEAFTVLLSRYKPLVRSRASSMFIAGSDHEDVVQEGMIGLFKAVRDFDPARGASFRTFASQCVTAQIRNAVRDQGAKSTGS